MEENIINNGQREKLHGISGTSKVRKCYLQGAGHIVSAALLAAQVVCKHPSRRRYSWSNIWKRKALCCAEK